MNYDNETYKRYKITPYRLQVIRLLSEGMIEKEIAPIVKRSTSSVGMVKARLRETMNCKTTAELFVKLTREGIL